MDTGKLETYLAVCKEASFTKAAEKLFITPAAVKKQIDSLEEEAGVKLLIRRPTGCELTAAGEQFRKDAKKILNMVHASIDGLQKLDQAQELTIRIGHSAKLDYSFISHLTSLYCDNHPNHYLHFVRKNKSELQTALLNHEIDCFVVINPSPAEFRAVKHVQVGSSVIHAVMNKKHPLASKEMVTFEDLLPYRLFIPSVIDHSLYGDFEASAAERPWILDQSDRNEMMISLLKNGIVLYPCKVFHDTAIPFDYPPLPIRFYYLENDEELAEVYRCMQSVLEDTEISFL